jgi:hypothetical protein
MSPEDILNVAKALTGKDSPKFFELAPDRLQNEATTESGLIVPRELTDPPYDFPEFVGRFPARQELEVLGPDTPREPIGWTIHEMTDEEIEEENSPENLQRLREERRAMSPYRRPMSMGSTSLPVLQQLWGTPWCNAAANFLPALRPSCVRVTRGEVTLDAVNWRVTVYLNDDNTISRIEQEVEVGLVGFRNGHDASNYFAGNHEALEAPQSNVVINPRALNSLRINI